MLCRGDEGGEEKPKRVLLDEGEALDRERRRALERDDCSLLAVGKVGEHVVDGEDHAGEGREALRERRALRRLDDAPPARRFVVRDGGRAALGEVLRAGDRPGRAEEGHLARVDLRGQLARSRRTVGPGCVRVEARQKRDRTDDDGLAGRERARRAHRVGLRLGSLDDRGLVECVHLRVDRIGDSVDGLGVGPVAVELGKVGVRPTGEGHGPEHRPQMLTGKPDPAGVRHLLALVEDEHAGDGDAVQREHRAKIDELALGVVRHEDGELERRSDRQGVAARLLEVCGGSEARRGGDRRRRWSSRRARSSAASRSDSGLP